MSWLESYAADWREGKLPSHVEHRAGTVASSKMRRFATVKDAAVMLGVSEQRIRLLLGSGRVQGARRVRGAWRIPLVHVNGQWTVRATMGRRGPQAAYSEPRETIVPF